MLMSAVSSLKAPERRLGIVLVAAFVLVYLLPLGVRPIAVPDEARYGEIAREMLASGDWVSPHFNGVRYFEKPVLGHWLNAASLAAFGENPFAVRLPTALATGLTALLIFLFMARFSSATTGLLAGGIYLTSLEVLGVGTFSVLDPLLTLFLTAAVMAYYWADQESNAKRRALATIVCGIACGGAFLSKGFLAYAVPVLVIAPYLASEQAWRKLALSGWTPLAVSILVALPWGVLIHLREPDFWHYFFFVEHVQRLAADNAQHTRPSWYFLALLPLLAFPWIYLLPAALKGLSSCREPRGFVKLLVLWIVMPLLFFSLARGKLATYILPCFAPFAMLLAIGLRRYLSSPANAALRLGVALLALINAVALLALFMSDNGQWGEAVYADGESWRRALLYLALLAAIAFGAAALRGRGSALRLAAIAGALLPVYVFGTVAMPDRIRDSKTPVPFLTSNAPSIDAKTLLIADGDLFGALSWFAKRNDVYLLMSRGEISYGLSYPDSTQRYLDQIRFAELLATRKQRDVIIFCTQESAPRIAELLPIDAVRRERGDFVLWHLGAGGG
jgi:4-amino-4-deoxy-L-arabinose transferase